MLRGTTLFICDECRKTFLAPDIEYNATIFSAPQVCPRCQSKHTMPTGIGSLLGRFNPQRRFYKRIWELHDKESLNP